MTGIGLVADYFENPDPSQPGDPSLKAFVVGVQAAASNSMAKSFAAGELRNPTGDGKTIADGINVRHASSEMLACLRKFADDVVEVGEEQIKEAMRTVYNDRGLGEIKQSAMQQYAKNPDIKCGERLGSLNILEGAAATPLAALASGKIHLQNYADQLGRQLNVVCVLTGSNIDQERLQEIVGSA